MADQAGIDPTEVIQAADNIEALEVTTPTLILRLLTAGATPREAVTDLVRNAMLVAEGRRPSREAVVIELEDVRDRVTPLDPMRPALDLLEDLLGGIHGCRLLYEEYSDHSEDDTEDTAEDENEAITLAFIEEVRTEAAEHQDRLS